MRKNISLILFLALCPVMFLYFEFSQEVNYWLGLNPDQIGPLDWVGILVFAAVPIGSFIWLLYELGVIKKHVYNFEKKSPPPRH